MNFISFIGTFPCTPTHSNSVSQSDTHAMLRFVYGRQDRCLITRVSSLLFVLICLAGGSAAVAQPAALHAGDRYDRPTVRVTQTINRDWTFNYFPSSRVDEHRAVPDLDDATWLAVALPHTWQTYETTMIIWMR